DDIVTDEFPGLFAAKRGRTTQEWSLVIREPPVGDIVDELAGQNGLPEYSPVTPQVQLVPIDLGASVQDSHSLPAEAGIEGVSGQIHILAGIKNHRSPVADKVFVQATKVDTDPAGIEIDLELLEFPGGAGPNLPSQVAHLEVWILLSGDSDASECGAEN